MLGEVGKRRGETRRRFFISLVRVHGMRGGFKTDGYDFP